MCEQSSVLPSCPELAFSQRQLPQGPSFHLEVVEPVLKHSGDTGNSCVNLPALSCVPGLFFFFFLEVPQRPPCLLPSGSPICHLSLLGPWAESPADTSGADTQGLLQALAHRQVGYGLMAGVERQWSSRGSAEWASPQLTAHESTRFKPAPLCAQSPASSPQCC